MASQKHPTKQNGTNKSQIIKELDQASQYPSRGKYGHFLKDESASIKYLQISEGFRQWLQMLGHPKESVINGYKKSKELFGFMERRGLKRVGEITPKLLQDFISYLSVRQNKRDGGGLKNSYINSYIGMIKKLSRYLTEVHGLHLYYILNYQPRQRVKVTVLTRLEVQVLYDVIDQGFKCLRLRNRTILDLYYGCGLRRREGVMLDIKDVNLQSRRIHVRYGKGYQQRYVPFTHKLEKRFCEYLEYGRPPLDRRLESEAFLLGLYGRRLSGQAVYEMVKRLRIRTEINPEKVNKIGIHTLRHSIATHLHHGGLSIEKVAQFLGHKTLESTQVYTHLVHELR